MSTESQDLLFKEINQLYAEKFGEPVSLYMVIGVSFDELIDGMKKAIKTGKPYKYPAHPEDAIF